VSFVFIDAEDEVDGQIGAAYRDKYRRYAGPILDSVLTLRLALRRSNLYLTDSPNCVRILGETRLPAMRWCAEAQPLGSR
jgi:hypothetical protein